MAALVVAKSSVFNFSDGMNSKLCPVTDLFNLRLQRISKNLVVLGHYRRIMIIWSGYRIHEPGLNNV